MNSVDNKINKFKYTVINNFNDLDLVNFYGNIDNIKIILSSDEFFGKLKYYTTGYYDYQQNIIVINKDKIDDYNLYHELFHMASTFKENLKTYVQTGFYQFVDNKSIGMGLNEGYTELLTRRYFGKDTDEYSYEFEYNIVKYVEDIIGKNKMSSFYLRGGLASLIKELNKDVYINDIMRFISNVDFVFYHIYDEDYKDEIIKKVNKINIFLVNLKLKKYLMIYDMEYLKDNKDELLKVQYNKKYLDKLNSIQDSVFFDYIFHNERKIR